MNNTVKKIVAAPYTCPDPIGSMSRTIQIFIHLDFQDITGFTARYIWIFLAIFKRMIPLNTKNYILGNFFENPDISGFSSSSNMDANPSDRYPAITA